LTDLAVLGIRFETQGAVQAEAQLDGLAAASTKAETATDRLAAAARGNGTAMAGMNAAVRQQAAVLTATRGAMGLTAAEGLNMGRQMSDVGVQMAMGMSPFMIAVQQGPQIFDVFQQAALRAGTSIRSAMVATGAAVWTAMAPLLPIIAAIGLAVGAVAGSFAIFSREASKSVGDVTAGLGLSEAQLKRLKDEGVTTTATMGDTFRALGTTIKETITGVIGPQLDWLNNAFSDTYRWIVDKGLAAVRALAGAFGGAFFAIRATWRQLPAVIADVAVQAANGAIRAVEWMINKVGQGINTVIVAARELSRINPAFRPANSVPLIGAVDLGQIANGNDGAASRAGEAWGAEWARGADAGIRALEGTFERFMTNLARTTGARVQDAAGDAAAQAQAGAAGSYSGRGLFEEMFPTQRSSLRPLDAFVAMLDPLKAVTQELRLIDGLAQDAARGMASAFGESGRAMGDLLTTMTGYRSSLAQIAVALKDGDLNGAQAARARSAAEVQAYGDSLAAAKGFFREGSDGYKALQAAEQGYRMVQFAMAVQAMIMGGQETSATVGQNLIKSASHGVVAVARAMASLPFPLNLAAGAATIAALAAIGVRIAGGSSSKPSEARGQDESTNTARQQAASAQSGGQAFVRSLAQSIKVEIGVNDDRFNAYVDGRAAPMAAQAAAGAYGATRSDAASAQRRSRQRFL
jgi:hypothetical protein